MLAPGVVLNRDPGVHLRNLKTTPPIEEVADTCVECGFCEPVCPSRDLTTTPRQRIVAAPRDGAPAARARRCCERCSSEYEYDAIETCAADGTCMLACPVGIDTGKLDQGASATRRARRARGAGRAARRRALGAVERAARGRAARRRRVARGARGRAVRGAVARPRRRSRGRSWSRSGRRDDAARPAPAARCRDDRAGGRAAVYMPACINRIFGGLARPTPAASLPEALVARLGAGRAAGVDPARRRRALLRDAVDLEGLRDGARAGWRTARSSALWRWTTAGELPIVIDASSCTLGLADEVVPLL